MDRRRFIGVVTAFLGTAPLAARAQPAKSQTIGFLGNGSPTTLSSQDEAFRKSLRELGWIEGQNVTLDYRWAEGNPDRLPALVAELVQAKVDVIVLSGTPAIRAVQNATRTIPVVFVVLTDAVTLGFVPSLARPGGNMTGVASQFEELITKQLQLLNELAAQHGLPACYEFRNYVRDGGLMSYGPSINAMFERSASYVDKILKGAKPGDLPIEQPTKFELVINLKTAKALGITIPQSLLLRADEVIQ